MGTSSCRYRSRSTACERYRTHGLRFAFVLFTFVIALFAQSGEENLRRLREEMVRTQLAGWSWGVEAVRDPRVLDSFRLPQRSVFSIVCFPCANATTPRTVGRHPRSR